MPIFPVYGQFIEILPFKFKKFVRLEVLSEGVGQDSTVYLQMVFFFSVLVVAKYTASHMPFSATYIVVV